MASFQPPRTKQLCKNNCWHRLASFQPCLSPRLESNKQQLLFTFFTTSAQLTHAVSHREELPHFQWHVYTGNTTDVPRSFHETRWSAPLSTALFANRHGKQEPSRAPKTLCFDTCEGSSISLQKQIRRCDQGRRILGVFWRHARVVEGQVGSGYPETGNLRQIAKSGTEWMGSLALWAIAN